MYDDIDWQKQRVKIIDGDAVSIVGSDGDYNETLQINVPGHYDVEGVGGSAAGGRVTGFVASDTAPAFAD